MFCSLRGLAVFLSLFSSSSNARYRTGGKDCSFNSRIYAGRERSISAAAAALPSMPPPAAGPPPAPPRAAAAANGSSVQTARRQGTVAGCWLLLAPLLSGSAGKERQLRSPCPLSSLPCLPLLPRRCLSLGSARSYSCAHVWVGVLLFWLGFLGCVHFQNFFLQTSLFIYHIKYFTSCMEH